MSNPQKKISWLVLASMLIGAGLLFIAVGRSRNPVSSPLPQTLNGRYRRNLSLQPEAFNLSRKLGRRFLSERGTSTLIGTLSIGGQQKNVSITRDQTNDGEQVNITIIGGSILTWDRTQGSLASGRPATASDRELIERLVFDSPDQFVLAQLRGASYFTVAHNVRPTDAGDNYSGPLWNVVRVDDPERGEAKQPQSRWRLYYLNAAIGLIDRIESEVQGHRIAAEFTGWTDQNGEKVPTQITWKRQGETLMQLRLMSFSHAAE